MTHFVPSAADRNKNGGSSNWGGVLETWRLGVSRRLPEHRWMNFSYCMTTSAVMDGMPCMIWRQQANDCRTHQSTTVDDSVFPGENKDGKGTSFCRVGTWQTYKDQRKSTIGIDYRGRALQHQLASKWQWNRHVSLVCVHGWSAAGYPTTIPARNITEEFGVPIVFVAPLQLLRN